MVIYRLMQLALAAAAVLGESVTVRPGCSNPTVRQEWRSLTRQERAEWITAVKCLHELPHNSSLTPVFNTTYSGIPPVNTSSSHYDDWVYVHMDLNPAIHFTAHFLPWHRAFVKDFETTLQEKCGYKGSQPYWNWTLDASNFEDSAFWDHNSTSGVGGWGDPDNDYQITSGGFAHLEHAYPVPHRIRRNYTASLPTTPNVPLTDEFTPESQEAMVNDFEGDFIGFQTEIESGSHGAIHLIVNADLLGTCPANAPAGCTRGPKWSLNDPLFMMHHAMVDKLWYDWQTAHPANFWSFDGGSVAIVENFVPDPAFPNGAPPFVSFATPILTSGIMNNYTIYELMDPLNERLCYIYK